MSKWDKPSFMQHATRRAYAQPDQVGWAAWWELHGVVVAFEALDGGMVYSWD